MIRKFTLSLGLVIAFSGSSITASKAENSGPILPLSQVKAGSKGIVRTVFSGGKIESFEVEITGVVRNWIGPKHDLILAKLTDPRVAKSGAAAGMSGSPLYIDGKIAGALSYGVQVFETERYAGFTPIEDMLAVGRYNGQSETRENLFVSTGDSRDSTGFNGQIRPLATPLSVSGISPRVFNSLLPELQSAGLHPLMGGGGMDPTPFDAPFEPGAAVAGILVCGDINISGVGTVTYCDGDTVYGFGHPFFQTGSVSMPMAKAEIVAILPSSYQSYKISNVRDIIGTIKQDRLTAIQGKIGEFTRMIPVTIDAVIAGEAPKKYECQVFQNSRFTPMLIQMLLMQTSIGTLDFADKFTTQVTGEVIIRGEQSLRVNEFCSGNDGKQFAASLNLPGFLHQLYANPFKPLDIDSIHLTVRTAPREQTYVVESLTLDKSKVVSGELVTGTVGLRSFQDKVVYEKISLRVPHEVKTGVLNVVVSDATAIIEPQRNPKSLAELIGKLNETRPKHQLYTRLETPTRGAVINNEKLVELPESVLGVLDSRTYQAGDLLLPMHTLQEDRITFNGIISGQKSLQVVIQ